jgi:fumarate hydratase class II
MNIAAYEKLVSYTIPSIDKLITTLSAKSSEMAEIVKIGRTHLMDATPISFGQEFSGYVSQLKYGVRSLKISLSHLSELALGGTAVGTGLNAPEGFDREVAAEIERLTGIAFVTAENKFEALAANDAIVETHSGLKLLAVSLMKIANDIRLSASGPRSGIGEIIIPQNEPGSSIMPGKVNPTQAEAMTMVCAQIMGNDTTITIAGSAGQFELNVFKPVMISALLQSAVLLADVCMTFNEFCVKGIKANMEKIDMNLKSSLMLVTALNSHIGYENAAKIAKKAFAENKTLKAAALELNLLTDQQFDEWIVPDKMIMPDKI